MNKTIFDDARDPDTPPEVLNELAYHTNHTVRSCVAKNPNTPVTILKKLAEDEVVWIRYDVAENPNIPVSALVKLVNDENGNYDPILCAIARNPNTPAFLLEQLIARNRSLLNSYIEANPNTTQRIRNYIIAKSYVNSNRH